MTVRLAGYFLQNARGLDFLDGTNSTWSLNSVTNEISLAIMATTAAIADGAVTYVKIQNGGPLSVLGRSANSSGVLNDISAGADGQVLLRNASTLAWTAPSAPAAGLTISTNLAFAFANDLGALEGLSGVGLAVRTTTDTWANRTLQPPAAGITWTNPTGVAGDPALVLANDLGALEALASTGLAARTGTDTWAQRALQPPAAGLTISNPAGVAGDPTLALANDLSALEALASTGIAVRTATDTWAQRTLQVPAAGLTVSNPAGVAGDPTFTLANDLSALEGISGTGMAARTTTDTWTVRTHTGSASITVTNGDGVSGAPTYSVNTSWVGQTAITTLGTITTGTWTGTAIAAINGGTGFTTYALGDTIYSDATNSLAKLAGNITTTKKFYNQTGNGSISAAPAWSALASADIPDMGANPTGTIGLTAVNGTATRSYVRSDGAPALSQAISPNWSGTHFFKGAASTTTISNPGVSMGVSTTSTNAAIVMCCTGAATDAHLWDLRAAPTTLSMFTRDDGFSGKFVYSFTRAANVLTDIALGNATDNNTFTFNGTGNVTFGGSITSGTWSATAVAATKGGTGITAYTLGDTIYSSAANTLLALAGNTTTTKKFYTQTGNGSVSAAPGWNTIAAADVPALTTALSKSATNVYTGVGAYRTADTTANSATLAADSDLTLTFNETGHYKISIELSFYEATAGTGGFQFDLNSGTATIGSFFLDVIGFGTALFGNAGITSVATATGVGTVVTSSAAPSWIKATGYVNISGTGTLAIRWAQNTLLAIDPTTLKKGSSFIATKLA